MKPLFLLMTSITLLCGIAVTVDGIVGNGESAAASPGEQSLVPDFLGDNRSDDSFVVHEWGTFTSFSGSDGIKLEFCPLVTNDLPGFVSNRSKASGFWFGKSTLTALQRMETPVTYFYTGVERDVSVKVEFPEGLLTEFYPPVRQLAPQPDDKALSTIWQESNVATAPPLKNSMLDWGQVHLIPAASLHAQVEDEELSRRIGRHVERTMVPEARGFQHYAAARNTDSAIVQVRFLDKQQDDCTKASGTDYFEKFLFYRGVGNFELPLTLSETEHGAFSLENAGDEKVRSLFLVAVTGDQVRFRRFDGIDPRSRLTLTPSDSTSTIDNLAADMVASLVQEGLYEKEAHAMVACWRSSWFGEEGTRLLYMVPGRITDQLLPLQIDPQPDETVRVLVGRMEIMSAADEERVTRLVTSSAEARLAAPTEDQHNFRSPALDQLLSLGRLAEPALVRVRHMATDEHLRDEAARLMQDLQKAQANPARAKSSDDEAEALKRTPEVLSGEG